MRRTVVRIDSWSDVWYQRIPYVIVLGIGLKLIRQLYDSDRQVDPQAVTS